MDPSRLPGSPRRRAGAARPRRRLGALVGSTIGKAVDGQKLLMLFALLMLGVGAMMFRSRGGGDPGVRRMSRHLLTASAAAST